MSQLHVINLLVYIYAPIASVFLENSNTEKLCLLPMPLATVVLGFEPLSTTASSTASHHKHTRKGILTQMEVV